MRVQNVKRAACGLALSAAALLALAPAAFADVASSVVLGAPTYVEGAVGGYKFNDVLVTGDVKTVSISVTGAGKLDTGGTTLRPSVIDASKTSATYNVSSAEEAQTALRAIVFTGCKSTTEVSVTVDGNKSTLTNLPSGTTLSKVDDHYYMYVPEKLSWSSAYNKAKTYRLNGMQGYLATLTSDEEYEVLNERANDQGGWIGGTLMVYNDGKDTKIVDASSLAQEKGTFAYPSTKTNYNNRQSGAIGDYYWACGPEAGVSFTEAIDAGLDTGDSNEPNAYKHTGNDQPWGSMEDKLGMTEYECCLLANNDGKLQINDITETGYESSGYADGYFVEFGGYAEGEDPGAPNASLTASDTASFKSEHADELVYSANGNKLTVKCTSTDKAELCPIPADGLTLTLTNGEKLYDGKTVEMVGTTAERKAWKAAGLTLPKASVTYSKTETGEYSAADKVRNAGYYQVSLTAGDATATSTYSISKRKYYADYYFLRAKDKTYDGNTTAELYMEEESGVIAFGGAVSGDDVELVAKGSFSDKNVGTNKTVTIDSLTLTGADAVNYELYTFDEGYSSARTLTASITAREVKLDWGSTEFEYTGETQIPTCTLSNTVEGEEVGLKVEGAQSAVGEDYMATASLTGANDVLANYTLPEKNAVGFSIVKASIAPVVSIGGWTYGDAENKPQLDDSTNPGNGKVAYEYAARVDGAAPSEDAWTVEVPTNAGDYTVRATVAESENYKSGSASADFTIAPKNIAGAKVVLGDALTSSGKEQEQTVELVVLGNSVLADDDYAISGNKVTASGKYELTVVGTGNYTGEVTVSFTVAVGPDEAAANGVADKIAAIGDVAYDDASKAAIEAARKAYDGLTDEQKKLIDPAVLKQLTDAEAAYKQAKAEAEEKTKQEAAKKTVVTKTVVKTDGLAVTGDAAAGAAAVLAVGVLASVAGIAARRRKE